MKKKQKRHVRVSKKGKVFEAGQGVGQVAHTSKAIARRRGFLGAQTKAFGKAVGREMLNAAKIVAVDAAGVGLTTFIGSYAGHMAGSRMSRRNVAKLAGAEALVAGAAAGGSGLFAHYAERMAGKVFGRKK